MAVDITTPLNTAFREFKRYTGDGLANEPTGAALPIGDPASGVHNPDKPTIRGAFSTVETQINSGLADIDTAVTAAEAAQAAAENAAGANLANASSRAAAVATTIPSSVGYIRTAGYTTAGDGGEALYRKKNVLEVDLPGDFTSTDGARWALAERTLTPEMFGAVGDGTTDDAEAVEDCLELAYDNKLAVLFGGKTYYFARVVHTRNALNYHYRPGFRIGGYGKNTVLTRGVAGGAAAVYDSANSIASQACLAVHCSNTVIENLSFENNTIGLYFGKDPRTADVTHASFNRVRNTFYYYNGTAIYFQPGLGCYYNDFDGFHIAHAQIGVHLGLWIGTTGTPNVNGNNFSNGRVTRAWIGYLIERGSGNSFNECHAEGCKASDALMVGPEPTAYKAAALAGKCVAYMVSGSGGQAIQNTFRGMRNEANDWDIWDFGFRNIWEPAIVSDAGVDAKVWFSNDVNRVDGQAFFHQTLGLSGKQNALADSGVLARGAAGRPFVSKEWEFNAGTRESLDGSKHYRRRRIIDLGAFTSGEAKTITVQADDASFGDSVTYFDLVIAAHETTNDFGYGTKAKAIASRNAARAPTRTYVFDVVSARATGTAGGDTADPWNVAIGVVTNNVRLTVTAPTRVFESAVLIVDETIARM